MKSQRASAAGRSQSYWLLSRLFLEQPDIALLSEIAAVLDTANPTERAPEAASLQASVRAALASDQALTDLQVEYTRLLGGASRSSGVPEPYESVAREGRLFGECAEAVAAAYVEAGHADLVSDTGPPDHVGTELRFMALLCYHEMNAWADDDEGEATGLLQRELAFLDDHLLPWVPSLCGALGDLARHSFYLAVASLTASLCEQNRGDIAAFLDGCAAGAA